MRRARIPGGDSRALLQAAAHLYQLQGRFDLALAILLRLQQPDTFAFVTKHSLLPLLRPSHVAALVRIDEVLPLSHSSSICVQETHMIDKNAPLFAPVLDLAACLCGGGPPLMLHIPAGESNKAAG